LVEQFSSTLDHIEVTVCNRIEAARVNRTSHRQKFAEELENEKRIEENDDAPAIAVATAGE
jgi:hypothetical protein